MLCSREFEVSSFVCKLATNTLNKSKYHVKIAKRILNDLYVSINEEILYWIDQGSIFAKTNWLFIEDPIITTIEK